ncbi:DUF5105 domain-containing protein [Metabacillus fastidiosus]|uniref:DUF5105 domain-containing protein n=1 Tax=Metabacillus fastidiosus TaxID=1458 RepID=UPI002E1F0D69|nr:DUF5105 domain-containing protein [Metabacillus fastidiosus]
MFKRINFLLVILAVFLILSACSDKTEKTGGTAKSKQIEAKIESAQYIKSSRIEEEDQDAIAVKINVKNLLDSEIRLSSYDGVKLYDGDQQMSTESDLYDSKVGLDIDTSGGIGAGKSKTILAIFEVEKDKKYEIGLNPSIIGEEVKEVMLELDTAKYAESYETLDDPAKAFAAYVDQIYYDKENSDYEELVTADKPALQEAAKKTFRDTIKDFISGEISDEQIEKMYLSYRNMLAEKAKVDVRTIGYANDKAVVSVNITTIPLRDAYSVISDYGREFSEDTGSYDRQEKTEYIISKFDEILSSMELKTSENKIEIPITKKDGKWIIKSVDKYGEKLDNIFIKGAVY